MRGERRKKKNSGKGVATTSYHECSFLVPSNHEERDDRLGDAKLGARKKALTPMDGVGQKLGNFHTCMVDQDGTD